MIGLGNTLGGQVGILRQVASEVEREQRIARLVIEAQLGNRAFKRDIAAAQFVSVLAQVLQRFGCHCQFVHGAADIIRRHDRQTLLVSTGFDFLALIADLAAPHVLRALCAKCRLRHCDRHVRNHAIVAVAVRRFGILGIPFSSIVFFGNRRVRTYHNNLNCQCIQSFLAAAVHDTEA